MTLRDERRGLTKIWINRFVQYLGFILLLVARPNNRDRGGCLVAVRVSYGGKGAGQLVVFWVFEVLVAAGVDHPLSHRVQVNRAEEVFEPLAFLLQLDKELLRVAPRLSA